MKSTLINGQAIKLLNWFFDHQVKSVDIHLRCPNYPNAEYKSDNWTWITRHESLSHEKALALLGWCSFKNCHGADIFLRPHRHDKQAILFLDDLPIERALAVSKKYQSIIIETSPNNHQLWLFISRSLDTSDRKRAQQYLAKLGYTDKGSLSGDHLGRLCGYRSQKRKCWVKYVGQYNTAPYNPIIEKLSTFPQGGACAKKREGFSSQSERDFSWVLTNIRKGVATKILTEMLTLYASERGKPAPSKYAMRTVRRAMEILT
jgi:hypothetical protein